jgi:hypothetical protein
MSTMPRKTITAVGRPYSKKAKIVGGMAASQKPITGI